MPNGTYERIRKNCDTLPLRFKTCLIWCGVKIISSSLNETITFGGAEEVSKDGNMRAATQQLVLEGTQPQIRIVVMQTGGSMKRSRYGFSLFVAQGNRCVLSIEPSTQKALGHKLVTFVFGAHISSILL